MNCTIDQQKKNSIGFYRNQDESFECQAIVWFAEFVNGNECDVVVVFLAALRNAFEFIVLYQFRINSLSFNWVSSMAPTVTLLSTESFTFCFCCFIVRCVSFAMKNTLAGAFDIIGQAELLLNFVCCKMWWRTFASCKQSSDKMNVRFVVLF